MPRQNRRRDPEPLRPLGGAATERVEWRGEAYLVRSVTGSAAVKTYRCPGCDHPIHPGVPHVVAWPDGPGLAGIGLAGPGAAAERRHWHSGCWTARDNRRPTR